ncbi:unnamed protein product [Vitrella brassicaformis CCMP3155]|uniref:Uncharacterized protein n=1 Tax=Vitrella brassicaformis (strain CCMP3155) TaxID=1169540 RepID=A0A0G4FLJ4_VITBC|nr:unnamed protein product [Vitrella brassicaformis CCMP3155]|eukprot:CEM14880.1 unnamed protein product [Vitrella brassicaformis CCMP3155]
MADKPVPRVKNPGKSSQKRENQKESEREQLPELIKLVAKEPGFEDTEVKYGAALPPGVTKITFLAASWEKDELFANMAHATGCLHNLVDGYVAQARSEMIAGRTNDNLTKTRRTNIVKLEKSFTGVFKLLEEHMAEAESMACVFATHMTINYTLIQLLRFVAGLHKRRPEYGSYCNSVRDSMFSNRYTPVKDRGRNHRLCKMADEPVPRTKASGKSAPLPAEGKGDTDDEGAAPDGASLFLCHAHIGPATDGPTQEAAGTPEATALDVLSVFSPAGRFMLQYSSEVAIIEGHLASGQRVVLKCDIPLGFAQRPEDASSTILRERPRRPPVTRVARGGARGSLAPTTGVLPIRLLPKEWHDYIIIDKTRVPEDLADRPNAAYKRVVMGIQGHFYISISEYISFLTPSVAERLRHRKTASKPQSSRKETGGISMGRAAGGSPHTRHIYTHSQLFHVSVCYLPVCDAMLASPDFCPRPMELCISAETLAASRAAAEQQDEADGDEEWEADSISPYDDQQEVTTAAEEDPIWSNSVSLTDLFAARADLPTANCLVNKIKRLQTTLKELGIAPHHIRSLALSLLVSQAEIFAAAWCTGMPAAITCWSSGGPPARVKGRRGRRVS